MRQSDRHVLDSGQTVVRFVYCIPESTKCIISTARTAMARAHA